MHSYLDLGQSVLSLPVPDGEDVIVGVIYNTQGVSSILAHRNIHNAWHNTAPKTKSLCQKAALNSSLIVLFPHRLGEWQADQGSVKEAYAQDMEGVEADRVPHPDMRSQLLCTHKQGQNTRKDISSVCRAYKVLKHILNPGNTWVSAERMCFQFLSLFI